MMKKNELLREITSLTKDTKAGKVKWDLLCQTTEYNPVDEKPVVEENGKKWVVDECFVSYHCVYQGEEFLMITYEMIHTNASQQKTTNLVFLPPLGMRYFDLRTLMEYAVETDQILVYEIHTLWILLLELHRSNPELVTLDADERVLTIEDEE